MKYFVEIVTEGVFTKNMYCRPLEIEYWGQSDTVLTSSTYSGKPTNFMKWAPITMILGEYWIGRSIQEYEQGISKMHHYHVPYEWCVGNLPDSHILKEESDEGKL